jgi:hypothetical protein
MKRYLFLFFIILILIKPSFGVGIGAKVLGDRFDFEPGLEKTYDYVLIPNAGVEMNYELYLNGDLKEYATLSHEKVENLDPDDAFTFSAKLELPESLEPGYHYLYVGVLESSTRGGGQLGGRTAAEDKITVRSLYSGKFLKANLGASNIAEAEPLDFKIKVDNWGIENIDYIRATVDIKDLDGAVLDTVNSNIVSLSKGQKETLKATWGTKGYNPGEYKAQAIVEYDGNHVETGEVDFKIGEYNILVLNYTEEFVIGKVNVFELELENRWNRQMEGVYADIEILDNSDDPITSLKTTVADISGFGSSKVSAPWDVKGKPGDYKAEVDLYYSGEVFEDELSINLIDGESVEFRGNTLLLVAVMILLIIVIVFELKRKYDPDRSKG